MGSCSNVLGELTRVALAFSWHRSHLKSRSVCPVGAVSKTMQLNSITCTYLPCAEDPSVSIHIYCSVFRQLVSFSHSLHKLRETHRLVNARNALHQIRHDRLGDIATFHSVHQVRISPMSAARISTARAIGYAPSKVRNGILFVDGWVNLLPA